MKLSEYEPRTQPFSHQWEGLRFLVKQRGRGCLFWEPGTGKSKTAIDFASFAHLSGKCAMALVVCPLSVFSVWEQQIAQHTPAGVKYRVVRLRGTSKNKAAMLHDLLLRVDLSTLTWVIINYESTWRPDVKKYLDRCNFDLVVADEAHRIKSATTQQAKAMHRLGKSAVYAVALTGTPITKNPLDLYSETKFVVEDLFKFRRADGSEKVMSWTEFKAHFCTVGAAHNVISYNHLDDLYGRVRDISSIKKKEDCLDLPEKVYETIMVSLDIHTQKAYIDMAESMIAFIEESEELRQQALATHNYGKVRAIARATIAKLLRLRQISNGFVGGTEDERIHTLSSEKIDATMDILQDLVDAGEKVVIFTVFRHDIDRLADRVGRYFGEGVFGVIHGGTPERARQRAIEAFQTDDDFKIIICQIGTGSEGITLHAARTVIFHGLDYSFGKYTQASDRIHRIGQTRSCVYYHIIARGTVEEDILGAISDKQEFSDVFLQRPSTLANKLREQVNKMKQQAKKIDLFAGAS